MKKIAKTVLQIVYFLRTTLTWRATAKKLATRQGGLKLHLGCGNRHHNDMLNCEYRPSSAADVVMDCGDLSRFKNGSVNQIFSNAFFEHLYRSQQIPLLRHCHRVLDENGTIVFLGIPDFRVIAEHYIQKAPGLKGVGEVFDLFHVYRYTHGDPEFAIGYWLEQLHKSLFDKEYIEYLLSSAGFQGWSIFNYCYPGEDIPLNLGFVAWKDQPKQSLREVLKPFNDYISDIKTIR